MSCSQFPFDSPWKGNFTGKESLFTMIWLAPKDEGAAPPTLKPVKQTFFSINGKAGLKGNNLGQQWSLTKVMALQQVVPKKLILLLKRELIMSVRRPCTPKRNDQHCCMSWSSGRSLGRATLLVVSLEICLFPLDD